MLSAAVVIGALRVSTKSQICFFHNLLLDLNFRSKFSAKETLILFMLEDSFLLTEFLLRSHLSKGTASFPIISIVKLARKRVVLEISTPVEQYWMLSYESFRNHTQDAAAELKLNFKFQSFHPFLL